MNKYSMEDLIKRIENCNDKEILQKLKEELISSNADDEDVKVLRNEALNRFKL